MPSDLNADRFRRQFNAMTKRSRSQQIGMLAESQFHQAGLRADLLPEKVRNDYGVDFLCQVAGPANTAGTASIGGAIVGAAVRGTDGRKAKIRLSQKNVEKLLSAQFPICLVLVHAPSSDRPRLFFRFVDAGFSLTLAALLSSGAKSTIVRSGDLLEWERFGEELMRATAPGFVERMRLSRASHAMNQILPTSQLMVQRTEHGDLTVVPVTDFFGQFAVDSAEERHRLHIAAFGAASQLRARFPELRIKPAVIDALRDLPTPIVLTSEVVEDTLRVAGPSGTATCVFERRRAGDHFGWVHASGFSITLSRAIKQDGLWVHLQSAQPDIATNAELQAFPDLWLFLEKCMAGAELWIPGTSVGVQIDTLGRLQRYGYFARHLRSAVELYAWPSGTWLLTDGSADETLHTLAWLSALREKVSTIEGFGMVVTDATDDELDSDPGSFIVPVCANTPRGGLVTWLTVDGHRMKAGGDIVGFRILTIQDVEIEQRDQRFVKTDWPELVFGSDLPTVSIPEMKTTTSTAQDWNVGILLQDGATAEEKKCSAPPPPTNPEQP